MNTEYLPCINILYYALEEWGKGNCGDHRREDFFLLSKATTKPKNFGVGLAHCDGGKKKKRKSGNITVRQCYS